MNISNRNGEELRILRTSLDLTLEEIAVEMKTTKQTVSNIELGKGSPMSKRFYNLIMDIYLNNREHKEKLRKKSEELRRLCK